MEETPLVKAIHELLHESAINDTDDRYKKIIAHVCAKLELLTQYEKERERYIAERAWDQAVYNLLVERGHIDDKHIDKEDFLNKYHPL